MTAEKEKDAARYRYLRANATSKFDPDDLEPYIVYRRELPWNVRYEEVMDMEIDELIKTSTQ